MHAALAPQVEAIYVIRASNYQVPSEIIRHTQIKIYFINKVNILIILILFWLLVYPSSYSFLTAVRLF